MQREVSYCKEQCSEFKTFSRTKLNTGSRLICTKLKNYYDVKIDQFNRVVVLLESAHITLYTAKSCLIHRYLYFNQNRVLRSLKPNFSNILESEK